MSTYDELKTRMVNEPSVEGAKAFLEHMGDCLKHSKAPVARALVSHLSHHVENQDWDAAAKRMMLIGDWVGRASDLVITGDDVRAAVQDHKQNK